jgi:hypothetical protein
MLQVTATTPANNDGCIFSSTTTSLLCNSCQKDKTEASHNESQSNANLNKGSASLEERINELEIKFARMSQLVTQHLSSGETISSSLPLFDFPDLSPSESKTPLSWAPSLDSPPVPSTRKRIPQVVVHEHLNGQQLTCPILDGNQKDEESKKKIEEGNEAIKENTSNSVKSPKQKWMDYLESVQDSTPDVDLQMEEFVRVPSQLEYLLNFGFLICIDSFLYVLTVLPLKFLWSLLLMLFASWTGHYKFHRR